MKIAVNVECFLPAFITFFRISQSGKVNFINKKKRKVERWSELPHKEVKKSKLRYSCRGIRKKAHIRGKSACFCTETMIKEAIRFCLSFTYWTTDEETGFLTRCTFILSFSTTLTIQKHSSGEYKRYLLLLPEHHISGTSYRTQLHNLI